MTKIELGEQSLSGNRKQLANRIIDSYPIDGTTSVVFSDSLILTDSGNRSTGYKKGT